MSCGSAAHAPSYTLERASRLVSTHSREHHAGRVFDTIDTVVWRDAETNLCVCAGAKRSSGTVCSLGSYWARSAVGSTLRMRRCLSCEAREPPRASLGLPLCHFCVSFPKGSRELGRFRSQIWTVERFQRTRSTCPRGFLTQNRPRGPRPQTRPRLAPTLKRHFRLGAGLWCSARAATSASNETSSANSTRRFFVPNAASATSTRLRTNTQYYQGAFRPKGKQRS